MPSNIVEPIVGSSYGMDCQATLRGTYAKCTWKENEVFGGNADIIVMLLLRSRKEYASVHFISQGHITPQLTARVSQVVTERNASMLLSDELGSCHCNAVLPVEEKGWPEIFDSVCFL
jgi:hypothetical protein